MLIVEDGTGKKDADSYVSVSEADTYLQNLGLDSDWSSLTQSEKEEALRTGTDYVDLQFGDRWKGRRAAREQSLDWPRAYVMDSDGFPINSNTVPSEVKNATIEAALRSLNQTLLPDQDSSAMVESESVSVGPISEKTSYSVPADGLPYFPKITKMVRRVTTSNTSIDLTRA